ncbi:MAG: hypothetical protein HQM12_02355 [SAR324 cluster bacterium]|nr:hypothetical protein [SAR324 cluster bacterium]
MGGLILDVIQDEKGFFWLGTSIGLYRYDGVKLIHYPKSPGSISDEFVRTVHESRDALWFGSYQGLDRMDKSTGLFRNFRPSQSQPSEEIKDDYILAMFQDSHGILWFGGEQGGLFRLEPATGFFETYTHSADIPTSLSDNHITAIVEDAAGVLWIGTHQGLNRFDPEKQEFTRLFLAPDDPTLPGGEKIKDLVRDRSGFLWVLTERALWKMDPATLQFTRMDDEQNRFSTHPAQIVALTATSQGTVWLISRQGAIYEVDPQNAKHPGTMVKPTNITHCINPQNIVVDSSDIPWVFCLSGKIYKGITRNFDLYQHDERDPTSLGSNLIGSIFVDHTQQVWVGTNSGLNRFDPVTERFTRYPPAILDHAGASLEFPIVTAINEDDRGRLWVVSINLNESILSVFDPQNGVYVKHWRHDPDSPQGYPRSQFINQIHQDREQPQFLWLAGYESGLVRVNTRTQQFSAFLPQNFLPQTVNSNKINRIHEDSQGRLWLGTQGNGLLVFDKQRQTFRQYRHDPQAANSLANDQVNMVSSDSIGRMWLGTESGLSRFFPETGMFQNFSTGDGLPVNNAYGIYEGQDRLLWISTKNGLSRFDPQIQRFHNYFKEDGLQDNVFYYFAHARQPDGILWFGGLNGLNRVVPLRMKENSHPPQVVMTSLKINGKPSRIPLYQQDHIILQWPEDSMEFEFSVLEYTNPEKNRLSYFLDGIDTAWHDSGTRRYGFYPHLPGGRHTLLVRGSNSNDVWTDRKITVTVIPPYWRTWWFRGGIGLSLLGALFWYVFRKFLKVERSRQQLAKEITVQEEKLSNADKIRESMDQELSIRYQDLWRTSEELKQSQERYARLVERSPDGVVLIQQGLVLFYNSAATRLVEADVPPESFLEWLDLSGIEQPVEWFHQQIQAGVPFEIIIRTPTDRKAIEAHAAPLRQMPEDSWLLILRDITERKKELQARQEFLQNISHELRTPVDNIVRFSRFLTDGVQCVRPKISQRRYLDILEQNARKMARLIAQFLELSKLREDLTIELFPVNVDLIVQQALSLTELLRKPEVILSYCPTDQELEVWANPFYLEDILCNLITNAYQYTPSGRITLSCERADQEVIFKVKDTGIGMDEHALQTIFTRFRRAQDVLGTPGTGLGLAIVQARLKQMNGLIGVESVKGEGSTFWFSLKLWQQEA